MNEQQRPESRQGPILRLFDFLGNPLEWSYTGRSILIIATTIIFQFLFVLKVHRQTADIELTRDLESLRWFVDWGRHLPWYPLLAVAAWLHRYRPDSKWFLWLVCVYWYFALAVSTWFYAPMHPALWISLIGVTLVLMVIVEWRTVAVGFALFYGIVEAGPLLTLFGYDTYAPFYSSTKSLGPLLRIDWWHEGYIALLLVMMILTFAYLIDRWRQREHAVKMARDELEWLTVALGKSRDGLEKHVAERTEELRRANEELVEEMEKRALVEETLRFTEYSVEHAADAIYWIGADGRITSVNNVACETLGYTREELVGSTVKLFSPGAKDIDWDKLWKQMVKLRNVTFETIHRRKDGAELPVEIKQSYLVFGETPYLCAFVRDISERKAVEKDRLLLERKLLESQKLESLGVLAGGIAHDFNNMLMTILGNTSLVLMDTAPGSPAYQHVRAVETAARRAADLTQQLLAYSGRGAVLQEALSLNDLTKEMAELLHISIGKSVNLCFEFDPDIPAIDVDATQIRQVVMNLIVNASEAIGAERGEIVLRTSQVHLTRQDLDRLRVGQGLEVGDYVRLQVSDTGSGMEPATLERLFDPFFTTKFSGRGLGLAATLGIVKAHRGALDVWSEPGKGTTFDVYLPVQPATQGTREAPAAKPRERAPERAQGLALVIDDEADVRTAMQNLLLRMGYQVEAFESGARVLQYLREHRGDSTPELALLDLTMPDWSGHETFRAMREVCPDLPVILMSGYAEEDATQQFDGVRPVGFLQKPFGIDQLRDAVARWIGATSPPPN